MQDYQLMAGDPYQYPVARSIAVRQLGIGKIIRVHTRSNGDIK